jgi:hypothetical protein
MPVFDEAQHAPTMKDRPLKDLNNFMTTQEGLTLAKSFMRIGNLQLRRRIVDLIKQIDKDRN